MSGKTLQVIPGQGGPSRNGPVMTVAFEPPPPTPADFYAWPGMPNPLPDEVIDKIIWHRKQLPTNYNFVAGTKGYHCIGKHHQAENVATAEEAKDPAYLAVLERMDRVELNSEGTAESVMTGDGAMFTWGRGLAYRNGAMDGAFTDFLAQSEGARKSFLDHGVTMVDKQLRIVDTDNKVILVHLDAAKYLDGLQPAALKKMLLSIFLKVTSDFGVAASTAQWKFTKTKFVSQYKKDIQGLIAAGWKTDAICYVVHCALWGSFAGFDVFKRTGGSLSQILRTEVENTHYYDIVEFPDKRGSYRRVPHTRGSYRPAITMVAAMGHGIMQGIMQGYRSEEEMLSVVQPGDTVFDMAKSTPPHKFYILRGSSGVAGDKDRFKVFAESHHYLEMSVLLGKLKALKYPDLKAKRDWYGEKDNESRRKFGPRLLVAMDAVLHKGEGEGSKWILDQARWAGISETSNWDQFDLIKKMVGIA